jgi:hypothetical protein
MLLPFTQIFSSTLKKYIRLRYRKILQQLSPEENFLQTTAVLLIIGEAGFFFRGSYRWFFFLLIPEVAPFNTLNRRLLRIYEIHLLEQLLKL